MAHQDDGIGLGGQKIFKPLYTLDVQMVGRLIEQQHVGSPQQQLGQLYTHTPSSAELTGRTVEILAREP